MRVSILPSLLVETFLRQLPYQLEALAVDDRWYDHTLTMFNLS
jgi:hypothetical protein